jgi:LCP family protein required for cell wall assembly
VALVGVLVACTLAFWGMSAALEPADSQTPSPTATLVHVKGSIAFPAPQSGLTFIAVLGSDSPTGAPDVGGGCDAIHIIAVNSNTKAVTILNMPRDSFIGGRKITDICRGAGFDQGIATIRQLTGIPIQFYAHTNFSNFMPLIDAVGGLDIHVYQPMHNPADTGTHFDPGDYHMLGGDTLAFSRDRYNTPGGDFGRSNDQSQIIISAFRKFNKQAIDMGYIFKLIRTGRQRAAFNAPLSDIVRLAMIARQLDPANVKSCTLNGGGGNVGGASVVILHGDDAAIWNQVAKDGSLPPNPDCFLGVNFQIPPG